MELSTVPYIRWAKYEGLMGEHRLTASAVSPIDWSDIGLDPATLKLTEFSPYGPSEVFDRLQEDWGVDPSGVVLGASASHAHFCFGASLVKPGDVIVHEVPGYLPLVDALSMLRVKTVPFQRRFDESYRLDVEQLKKTVIENDAKLVLLTDLHNPSGVSLGKEALLSIAEMCEVTGCHVIIDEMYRGFLDPDPGPACLLHPRIISVWGLNKIHGISQVRFGWGCATPELADRARRVFDSTTLHTSCLTDQVARAAMTHLDPLTQRGRRYAQEGWGIFSDWLQQQDLAVIPPDGGLTCFPEVPKEIARDGDHFRELCMEQGLNVTPGRFFGASQHVRIGFGLEEAQLKPALDILAKVLNPS
ncbi:MAG: pyridoxal phosphate-dependent aminotransferase [Planctomycetia bacterium]|nr:pyridoxal phosphate-dependent aminotransferase [Planctomycetia bacterium]